jgi:hypothetical protein
MMMVPEAAKIASTAVAARDQSAANRPDGAPKRPKFRGKIDFLSLDLCVIAFFGEAEGWVSFGLFIGGWRRLVRIPGSADLIPA